MIRIIYFYVRIPLATENNQQQQQLSLIFMAAQKKKHIPRM